MIIMNLAEFYHLLNIFFFEEGVFVWNTLMIFFIFLQHG